MRFVLPSGAGPADGLEHGLVSHDAASISGDRGLRLFDPRLFDGAGVDFFVRHWADTSFREGDGFGRPPLPVDAPPDATTANPGVTAREDVARSVALSSPSDRGEASDRSFNSDLVSAVLSLTVSTRVIGRGRVQGPENTGPGVSTLVSSAASMAQLAAAFSLRLRTGDDGAPTTGADRDPAESLGGPESPENGGQLPGSRDGATADTDTAALPQVAGLLTEGVSLGVATLECAAGVLTEPLLTTDAGALYWLGCSSWLLAAALACEGVRRCLPRRTDHGALSLRPPDFPPEADL
jgi:hypothetical protein